MSRIECPDDLPAAPDFNADARAADLHNDAQPYQGERATRENIDQILAQGHAWWRDVFKGAAR